MPLVSCATLTLYSMETCSYSVHPGWLVWRMDESYHVAKADGCCTGYNEEKEYGHKKKSSSDGDFMTQHIILIKGIWQDANWIRMRIHAFWD